MKLAKETRAYRMGARAESAAATADRILDATVALFHEHPSDHVRLDEVALRAGVTVQTIIRRFGGKEGLFEAAAAREVRRIRSARFKVTPGTISEIVANLVDHYETDGELALRILAEEDNVPALKVLADRGRTVHRDWCKYAFQPFLAGLTGDERIRRVAQLTAICDVYTWKLLRRDNGLSRCQTEHALVEMLAPFTEMS